MAEILVIIIFIFIVLAILIPAVIFLWLYIVDARQKEHSVLRNYPVVGKVRYLLENIGPELRQYLFANNREGKPFSRHQYINVVKAGKYKSRIHSFGSERDFDQPGFYRSEEHTSELQSRGHLVCRLLLEKKKQRTKAYVR